MNDFGEVGMVDMCENAEHLLVDGLAGDVKIRWETALLSNPGLTGSASSSGWRAAC